MTVSAADVAAAQEAERAAREKSEKAHKALEKAKADQKAAGEKLAAAKKKKEDAEKAKGEADGALAKAKADASSSKAACDQAKSEESNAAAASRFADARAQRVQALNPGQCTPETTSADAAAAQARTDLAAATARRETACAKATEDAKAQKKAEEDVEATSKSLTEANGEVVTATNEDSAAASALKQAVVDADAAALNAFVARTQREAVEKQFSAQGTVAAPQGPKPPQTDVGCPVMAVPPAEPDPGGVRSDTRANFSITGRHAIWQVDGYDYEETQGAAFEVTVGEKVSNLLGIELIKIAGGRFEEVGDWESKLVLGGDRRTIIGKRWERNIGLKAESVLTTVDEYTMRNANQHVAAQKLGLNPSDNETITPEMEEEAAKIVENHKQKLQEVRHQLKMNLAKSMEEFESLMTKVSYWKAEVKNIRWNIEDKFEKCRQLNLEAKKYQMKSDAFIKFLIVGTCTLKAGQFKGKAKSRYNMVAQAMADLQGQVKWN
jgi:hypothetical protein